LPVAQFYVSRFATKVNTDLAHPTILRINLKQSVLRTLIKIKTNVITSRTIRRNERSATGAHCQQQSCCFTRLAASQVLAPMCFQISSVIARAAKHIYIQFSNYPVVTYYLISALFQSSFPRVISFGRSQKKNCGHEELPVAQFYVSRFATK
ncbi:13242_t:CDS:2, partial [Dentiscutata heterogama]